MPGAFQSSSNAASRPLASAASRRVQPSSETRRGVSPGLRRAGPCRLRAAAARAGLDASTCGPEYRAARADHKWRALDCCRCVVFDNARTEPRLAEQAVALTPRI